MKNMDLNTGLLASIFTDAGDWTTIPWYALLPAVIAVCLAAYLLGSINSAIIVSKTFFGEDVRTKGSGNAGTTNVQRNYGNKAALLTLVGDMLKTALSIFIAGFVFGFNYVAGISVSEMCYVAGLFSIIGHVFPVYYGFKGGKGVLSTATMALVLSPVVALILIAIFVALVVFSRYISLGSVCAAALYPVVLNGYFPIFFGADAKPMPLMALASILLACLIVWCHRENLARIGRGEENKFSFKKKKPAPEEEVVESEDDAE